MLRGIIGYFGLAIIVGVAVRQYNPGFFTKKDAVLLGILWPVTLVGWAAIGICKVVYPDE